MALKFNDMWARPLLYTLLATYDEEMEKNGTSIHVSEDGYKVLVLMPYLIALFSKGSGRIKYPKKYVRSPFYPRNELEQDAHPLELSDDIQCQILVLNQDELERVVPFISDIALDYVRRKYMVDE